MQQLTYSDINQLIDQKQLHFYNFYNNDIKLDLQQTTKYYSKFSHDNINSNQKLTQLFLDIEVFTNNQGFTDNDLEEAPFPIYLITIIFSKTKIAHTYLLLFPNNMENFGINPNMSNDEYGKFINETEQWLLNELKVRKYLDCKYLDNDIQIKLNIYSDEKQLIVDCWKQIHEYDPDILSSFYGDMFDYPYLYYRIGKLFGEKNIGKILSKFGTVSIQNDRVQFVEYCVGDMLYFYKPRDEGGLQYGKKQPVYTLDNISQDELGIKKVEYKTNNITIDDFFLQNPKESTLYNIVDVLLIYALNNKLQFFDLHNPIRRAMKTNFHNSIIGSSALYDAFIFSRLDSENKRIRYGLTSETNVSFTKEYTSRFGNVRYKNKVFEPCAITANDFSKITKKFPGAYVKQPNAEIINDGMIIDFDATSMYPSNILQANISFDCYIARVIPPQCYATIKLLKQHLGKSHFPPALIGNVQKIVEDYIDNNSVTPKTENFLKFYYTILSLFTKLLETGKTFDDIAIPQSAEESLILKNLLIPLIDIMFTIHPSSNVYNDFVYDYVYKVDMNKPDWQDNRDILKATYPDGVFVIMHPMDSNTELKQITIDELFDLVQKFSISFSGCMFVKHSEKQGLFVNMLTEFADLRKKHKNLRNTFEKGSEDYSREDNNQNVFKRLMNTCYGLYGLSSFRYSNHWLARSITNNSLHALKCSMYIAEHYLIDKYGR